MKRHARLVKRYVCALLMLLCLAASIPGGASGNTSLRIVTNCDSWVSLRALANTYSKRLRSLPNGTYVNYIGGAENGFAYVLHNGTYGYVLEAYLERPNAAVRVSNCREYVSFRTSPTTRASRICKIPLGSMCVKICDSSGGFAKVYYDGQYGYVLDRYLKPINKDAGVHRRVVNCTSFISLRSAPSTKSARLAKIPLNQWVISLGNAGNGMAYVFYDGQYGFVLSKYLM